MTSQVDEVKYEVCSDRGGPTQFYNFKVQRKAVPVSLVSIVSERDELGPEVPNSTVPALLLYDNHLLLSRMADIAKLHSTWRSPIRIDVFDSE